MRFTLHVWRQPASDAPGRMVEYQAHDISKDMSVLEMLDLVNERLTERGEDPIAFSHDCREGICGSCALMINGVAHGPVKGAATCQVLSTFWNGYAGALWLGPSKTERRFRRLSLGRQHRWKQTSRGCKCN